VRSGGHGFCGVNAGGWRGGSGGVEGGMGGGRGEGRKGGRWEVSSCDRAIDELSRSRLGERECGTLRGTGIASSFDLTALAGRESRLRARDESQALIFGKKVAGKSG